MFSVADGSMPQLTSDFARDRVPRWSPDARSIYLYSDRRGHQVWRINADGSDLRQLTIGAELRMFPSPSPDGTKLVASDGDLRTVAIYDTRDFSKPLQVVTPPIEHKVGALQTREWSPDGRSFIVQASTPGGGPPSLYLYGVDAGTTHRIGGCGSSTWMKDGRRIVCFRMAGLVTIELATGQETQAGSRSGFTPGGVGLAADDTQLFVLTGSQSADIWVARFEQPARSQ
jgi:Tol biopolymer transport system component